ncbi:hypothetical protein JHK86_002473 [Glycine max]|nr:hypothetical protein JHK86_002473 [Glycine max]
MAAATLYLAKPSWSYTPKIPSLPRVRDSGIGTVKTKVKAKAGILGLGLFHFLNFVEPGSCLQLQFHEPPNALSLPTWAIHVSSVAEWIIAMALVWQYGEKSGYPAWKGLSWGMVLVALQAALTIIGNATMCIAAYRIYKSSQDS